MNKKRIGKICILMIAFVMFASCSLSMTDKVDAAGSSPANAEWIKLNTNVYGSVPGYNNTYHYYKFKTDNMDGVQYIAKSVATGDYETVAVIEDSNYNRVDSIERKNSYTVEYEYDFGAYAHSGSSLKFNLKKNQVYYISIKGNDYRNQVYDHEPNPYMICIQKIILKPSKPVFKYVKAKKKKIQIKYDKAKYASRYQVRYKKAGKKWSKPINNGIKLTWVKKGLKSKKKYSVQVRAIRRVGNKDYIGEWSKVRTVKIK